MLKQKGLEYQDVILLRASSSYSSDFQQTYSKAAINLLEKFFPEAI